jgi:hypothetical protein
MDENKKPLKRDCFFFLYDIVVKIIATTVINKE